MDTLNFPFPRTHLRPQMTLRLQANKYIKVKEAMQTVEEIDLANLNLRRASNQPTSTEEGVEPN